MHKLTMLWKNKEVEHTARVIVVGSELATVECVMKPSGPNHVRVESKNGIYLDTVLKYYAAEAIRDDTPIDCYIHPSLGIPDLGEEEKE